MTQNILFTNYKYEFSYELKHERKYEFNVKQ